MPPTPSSSASQTAQQFVDAQPSVIHAVRAVPLGKPWLETRLASEYSDWREEQKSWRETASLLHQSEHMTDLFVEGPDALKLFRDLSINGYRTFVAGQAKQFVAVSPEGYLIGDGILVQLEEDSFDLVGDETLALWVQFHAEKGDYDVTITSDPANHWFFPLRDRATDPVFYRFEVQGPNALKVIEAATGAEAPDTPLFHLTEFQISGHRVRAIRHGMAGQPGFELFGPYAEGESVRSALLTAGEPFGIVPVGSDAYFTANLESGWIVAGLPGYLAGEASREFREWAPAHAVWPLLGSFSADTIEDYMVTPYDIGYGSFVSTSHDYVGREALAALAGEKHKHKVTLIWDEDDFAELYRATLSPTSGEAPQFRGLRDVAYAATTLDAVQVDGKTIGFASQSGYVAADRRFISLAAVEEEYATPGTEVTILWGDDLSIPRSDVAAHRQVSVRATVAPTPFSDYARDVYRK